MAGAASAKMVEWTPTANGNQPKGATPQAHLRRPSMSWYPLYPPIPRFDDTDNLQAELASRAEQVAASVRGLEEAYFVTARTRVTDALDADGVSQDMDAIVAKLLA